MDIQQINHFLRPLIVLSDGYGDGDDYGYGSGYGYGDGSGYGNGDGNGDGYGNGNGDGSGYGDGNGYGYGYGDGDGSGYGILSFNKQKVYLIDNTKTILITIKNDVAQGFIINNDLTTSFCYIVRNNYYYSHGKTLKEAIKSLEEKTLLNLPISKRIENFKNKFKNLTIKVKATILYDWHFKLTGSCKFGRDNFIKTNNIDLKKKYSINEFIELTKNEYGSDIIMQLKNSYNIN